MDEDKKDRSEQVFHAFRLKGLHTLIDDHPLDCGTGHVSLFIDGRHYTGRVDDFVNRISGMPDADGRTISKTTLSQALEDLCSRADDG